MHANLQHTTLRSARIQAFRHPLVAPPPHGFQGGPVLDGSDEHRKLRHSRYWQPADKFSEADDDYDFLVPGEWAYAGPVYAHFGHFMSEMVHRILPSQQIFNRPKMLFVGVRNDPLLNNYSQFPRFLKEVLELFEIQPSDLTVISRNSTVETLHIVEAGSDFGGAGKPGYLEDLREFCQQRLRQLAPSSDAFEKVYVSRQMLPVGGSFLGESYLEHILRDEGFVTFYPEAHSLVEQMNVYEKAETLVFPEGSACHGTELLGQGMMNRCFLIARRQDHIEIFSKVLRPRSKQFAVADTAFSIGSIFGTRGEAPAAHAGVSLLDVNRIIPFFRDNNISPLRDFSVSKYLEYAEADLARYLHNTVKRGRATSLEDMEALCKKFAEVGARIQADKDPRSADAAQ